MTRSAPVRAGLYLLASLALFVLTSLLSSPLLSALVRLAFVLLLCAVEALLHGKHALPFPLFPTKERLSALFFLPVFLFITLAINLISASLTRFFGGSLPTFAQTPEVFFSAVLLAPLTEELLFRGLALHLFAPYGEKRAMLLSALAFSLAHTSLFQIPYAFAAGLLLAAVAMLSRSLLFPILFHVTYNLFTYFGSGIPMSILLPCMSAFAAAGFSLFLSHRPAYTPREKTALPLRDLLPFFAYLLLLVYLTVSAIL